MEIKSLQDTTLEQVYTAFGRAFGDYEVPFNMPVEKFAEMLATRDVTFDLSLGCFDGAELVSFILCGHRRIGALEYGYDGGTGTIKTYRQQGIGKRLANEWLAMLRTRGIDRVVLEVLENNTPAIDLYRKAGFQVTRAFDCFRGQKAAIPPAISAYAVDDEMAHYRTLDEGALATFPPSWQNARASVINAVDRYAYVGLTDGAKCIGYGLVHKVSGNIAQLGVAPAHRNTGLENAILGELGRRTASDTLAFINVEQGDYLAGPLRNAGFERFIGQYEMEVRLAG